ncbi:hypothetical protein ACJJTC_001695 [Scirpophaga incertulas]
MIQSEAESTSTTMNTADRDMKMKLFRLMYESVADSDLRTKRAELINIAYQNSTSFEIGYLMGDITDKFDMITQVSATLKRFHDEWKPIEHINAYEQIANQAIELNQLIELVRSIDKKHVNSLNKMPITMKDEN